MPWAEKIFEIIESKYNKYNQLIFTIKEILNKII